MRKIPALLAALGLAALSLTGCTSVGASSCTRSAAADAQLQSRVDVSGEVGSAPVVSFDTPMHLEQSSSWEVVAGEGTPIVADDQLVVLDVALYSGSTGDALVSTAFDGDMSRTFTLTQWITSFPDFGTLLHCATPGSRVVVALPPGGVEEQTATSLGLADDESTLVVVDVGKTYLARAAGTTVFNDAHGMPTVVRAPSGQPGIILPDTEPPGDITVQTLIRGEGAVLTDSDTARVHYTGMPWETGGTVFATTWGSAPESVSVSDPVLPGFAEALQGQTVGSQVLVVVPADEVPADASGVPTGTALVYVIDILGTDAAAQ
ncbi:MAG: FKBP-type peptidyl-prolyl cis-trans isomerase [Microbacterium sp.]